jgi:hypothetical protein
VPQAPVNVTYASAERDIQVGAWESELPADIVLVWKSGFAELRWLSTPS